MSGFLRSLYNLKINPLSDEGLVKIFPHSVDWHFVLPYPYRSTSVSKDTIYWLLHSVLVLLLLHFGRCLLCQGIQKATSFFYFNRFSVVRFILKFWFAWIWVLPIEIYMDLFAIFYMLISRYASTVCWRCFFFHFTISSSLSKIKYS